MPTPQQLDLEHYRGDTLAVLLTLWEDAGQTDPSDLSGATIVAQVRSSADATGVAAEFEVGIEGNAVTLVLDPSVTSSIPLSSVYDVQVDWASDGENVQTVVAGSLKLTADVTRVVAP